MLSCVPKALTVLAGQACARLMYQTNLFKKKTALKGGFFLNDICPVLLIAFLLIAFLFKASIPSQVKFSHGLADITDENIREKMLVHNDSKKRGMLFKLFFLRCKFSYISAEAKTIEMPL